MNYTLKKKKQREKQKLLNVVITFGSFAWIFFDFEYPVENNMKLTSFHDSHWASCPTTKKSITGFCVFLGSVSISWRSKKQSTISRSSFALEYHSFASLAWKLHCLTHLLLISIIQCLSFPNLLWQLKCLSLFKKWEYPSIPKLIDMLLDKNYKEDSNVYLILSIRLPTNLLTSSLKDYLHPSSNHFDIS